MGNIRSRLNKVEKAHVKNSSGKLFVIYQHYPKEEYIYDNKKFGSLDELCIANSINKNTSTIVVLDWYNDCEEITNSV